MAPKKASHPPPPPWVRPPRRRRLPQQDRSRFPVDVIRTAALRILREEGSDALTTNRIAEVAGVAVASVYQYFPNKEAVLASLYEELTRSEIEASTLWLSRAVSGSLDELIRGIIVRGIAWQRELRSLAPEFFQRFHREYALTTAVGGEHRVGSQSVEWMRGILAQHPDEVAVELDIAAFPAHSRSRLSNRDGDRREPRATQGWPARRCAFDHADRLHPPKAGLRNRGARPVRSCVSARATNERQGCATRN